MSKQKVTLSIDSHIYSQFKQYCLNHAIMLSKKIELWMSKEMKNFQDTKGKSSCVENELREGRR